MPAPLFSIVIPCYNRAHTISRAIVSCLNQTVSDLEIIISDDERSNDNIGRVVSKFRDRRLRLLHRHRGTSATGRNRGVDAAYGKYVAFLDSDDIFLNDKLEKCHAHLTNGATDVCYSQAYLYRGLPKLWIKPWRGLEENEKIFDYLFINKGWVPTSTIVLRTELARAIRYKEDLLFGQDIQFAVDLAKGGLRIVMIDEPLAVCDDMRVITRLSQNALYGPDESARHSFFAWVESQRAYMSDRAYKAYCASFRAMLLARDAPSEALGYIWTAYRAGVISGGRALAQCLQAFTPRLYRTLSDVVVRHRGVDPPVTCGNLENFDSVGRPRR